MPKVKTWLGDRLVGKVLNVFCGVNKIQGAVNCDLNPEMSPDILCDAMKLNEFFEPLSFDTAILDPPYSFYQAQTKYKGHSVHNIMVVKDHIKMIVKKRLIWFGWSIPATEGFRKTEILLIGHGGHRNATICCVEDRVGKKIPLNYLPLDILAGEHHD
jgi:hypothetical protein